MQTFQDIFKKSFLAGADAQITPLGIVLVMVLSLAVSAFIFIIYKKCYRGVLYSYNFNVAVALMTVITAMIIATISSNIVLSLGMVGALSIVRFRTAIKDPIDLIFLFWAVAAGIGIGARAYWIVLFGNLAVGLTFMLLSAFKRERKVYLLVVRCRTDASKEVMDFRRGTNIPCVPKPPAEKRRR
jgi:ABC-type spermidine/putrescine transport system permease subunit II